MKNEDVPGGLALAVTPAAASKTREILRARGLLDDGALRVFVAGGPALGMRYGLAVSRRVDEGDYVVHAGGVRFVVDYGSAELLAGSELDYRDDDAAVGFTILNPAGLHACGGVV